MRTIQLDLIQTLLVAIVALFAGRALVDAVPALRRYSIPAAVVGGGLFAVVLGVLGRVLGVQVAFDTSMQDALLLAFFTTIGLSGDVRSLLHGGRALFVFLAAAIGLIVVQNAIGVAVGLAMDLTPTMGLTLGSITLTGGHGTGAAYAQNFAEVQNIRGAMEVAMAAATAGLVIGGIVGGPVAERLIRRYRLTGSGGEAAAGEAEGAEEPITTDSLLRTLLAVLVALTVGRMLGALAADWPIVLPRFIWCLLIGLVIRNVAAAGVYKVDQSTVDAFGSVVLSIFLVVALMALRFGDLLALAGPLLVILALQTIAAALYATWITFRVMGRNYDAAVMSGAHVGFGLSSTAMALAIMRTLTNRHGPAPLALLLVPLVGAFFVDIMNALLIQGFMALPWFGF
ncbi:MAG TPA: sodium/glutamate symporter [Thermodesulfobacteriota bacterium]